MLRKQLFLLAVLVPSLALVACKRHDTDDNENATPPAAATVMPPAPATMASPSDTNTMPPAAATVASPASSMSGAAPSAETPFADLDKNHDGVLTKDELPADEMLSKHFSVADTNGDGKLSEAEATKHRADMAAKK